MPISSIPKTSTTHPLRIAEVRAHGGYGAIGISLCPGKKQLSAFSGAWDRDLTMDIGTIRDWGAHAVVTLIEGQEAFELRVLGLGEEVRRHHMQWFHLPVPDVTAPGETFERAWSSVGPQLRAMLRAGSNVLVHCKGGLGRAGTVAARLLVELGMAPDAAISEVRRVRPGAIETRTQEAHVERQRTIVEPLPATERERRLDRACGALLGLAVGDAVGTTLEFRRRDSYEPLTDMVGGGPFGLQPGEWTDDTAMALALGESLLADPALDEADLMDRFVGWRDKGRYSCTGGCFDIGITTTAALTRFQKTGDPVAGDTDPRTAGNGSLMRLSPVAVRHWRNPTILRDIAARQSRTTHAAPQAVEACRIFATLLAEAIEGQPRSMVMRHRDDVEREAVIAAIMAGRWSGMQRRDVLSSGYVAHSLEAALWAVATTGTFEGAVLAAANLGDDADTTAAIAGQLAGALYGAGAIPHHWLRRLAWEPRIRQLAVDLFEANET